MATPIPTETTTSTMNAWANRHRSSRSAQLIMTWQTAAMMSNWTARTAAKAGNGVQSTLSAE